MAVEIRPAVADDVTAIQQVGFATWPVAYSFAGADYVADGLATWWSREALLASLAHTTTLVAVDGDEVVGVGNLDLRGDVPMIWKLYVLPRAPAAAFYAAQGFTELRREPGERAGWPDTIWVERRVAAAARPGPRV